MCEVKRVLATSISLIFPRGYDVCVCLLSGNCLLTLSRYVTLWKQVGNANHYIWFAWVELEQKLRRTIESYVKEARMKFVLSRYVI